MAELELINSTLQRAARRRRFDRGLRGLWRGLFIGALIYLAALAAYKLAPIPGWVPLAGLAAGLTAALLGMAIGAWRRASMTETARWVDVEQGLKERLSTALEVSGKDDPSEWRALIVADAVEHAKEVDPRRLVPLALTRASKWAFLVLILAVGLGFVPEYRSKTFLQQQADAKNIKQVGKQLVTLTKQNLENRRPTLEATQKSLENVENLGEKLTRASLTRSDALRDLASATDKVKDQLKQLGKDPALRRMEDAARSAGGQHAQTAADMQKQINALKSKLGEKASDPAALDKLQKDLEKLQEDAKALTGKEGAEGEAAREQLSKSLGALSEQAAEMGLKLPDLDDAVAALAASQNDKFLKDLQAAVTDLEKLKDMAKTLQQLQAQAAEKMGKDLAEQLKYGQADAAQSTLSKMIDQLKSSSLSQEQLDKILSDVSKASDPAKPYGKVADLLKQAAKQMKQGEKAEAAESLSEASQELAKLMDQLGDAESLMATLEALKNATICIGTGQGWAQVKLPGFGRGGEPGSGVGTWADENGTWDGKQTDRWDNSGIERDDMDPRGVTDRGEGTITDLLKPSQLKGQFSPGAQMPSVTLKGVSIKGTSKLQLEEATTAAQNDAQAALNQDKVPKAYKNQVRDYFDDLKK